MFLPVIRRKPSSALEDFTQEEASRLRQMRCQFLQCPDSFNLDLSHRRLEFYRWLVQRGDLSEGIEAGA